MNETILQQTEALKPYLGTLQQRALVIGLLGAAAAVAGFLVEPEQFYRSYHLAFIFWISLSLGSLVILMLHHVGGGTWGFAIRRLLEAGTRTLPLMIVLFVPIVLGLHHLYEWTHADVVAADELLQKKAGYLNVPFFLVRAAIYFVLWSLLVFLLNRWSHQQDHTTQTFPTRRLQLLSGPGVVLFALTVTGASVDWIMSLEPHWFSTIFGVIYMVGQALVTWAFIILVAVPLSRRPPLDALLTNQRLRDLGTFLLACVMLWAYTSFSQLLIIWAGNLPEEITWYMTRLEGGWLVVGMLLIALHFTLPFLLLISSRIKARIPVLVSIALGLVFMRLVDLYWITAPAFAEKDQLHRAGLEVHWLDIVIPVAIGGIWVSVFFWQLKNRSLVPLNDPRFEDLLGQEEAQSHG